MSAIEIKKGHLLAWDVDFMKLAKILSRKKSLSFMLGRTDSYYSMILRPLPFMILWKYLKIKRVIMEFEIWLLSLFET